MTIKELKTEIDDQLFRLNKAKSNNIMVAQETERTKNVLMNFADEIVAALAYAIMADEKIELMAAEVEAADQELMEKDDEIRTLKEKSAKKPSGKKAAGASNVE